MTPNSFEKEARIIAEWMTGGISGFADEREIVLDAWTVQIASSLRSAYVAGMREAEHLINSECCHPADDCCCDSIERSIRKAADERLG